MMGVTIALYNLVKMSLFRLLKVRLITPINFSNLIIATFWQ